MNIFQQHLTKLIIILFSVGILIFFASYLLYNTKEQQKEFYSSHKVIAEQTVLTVANEIERILSQKEKLVKAFAEDNHVLLKGLIKNPGNEELFLRLNNKLSKYIIGYYSTSLASSNADLLIDDFDGYIGELCVADMKQYVETDVHLARVHPHPKVYHYDVVVRFESDNNEYLFMVSFKLDVLANILNLSSPEGHDLMLVQKDFDNLIEVTEHGSRLTMPERLDFRMQPQEMQRVLAQAPVPGTRWHVFSLIQPGVFESHDQGLKERNLWVYTDIVLLVVFFTVLLLVQVCKNKKVADDLANKNKEIEVLNAILKEKNEELSEQATTDALTKLYNRRYFDKQVEAEWSRASRLWLPFNIAFIDIDFFKQYNDMYGHQLGDMCLKIVGELLSGYFKRSNEFVARYGGEEFAVVNIGSKPDFFKICLQEVLSLLEDKDIEHKGSSVASHLTMSVGIASTSDAKATSSEILVGVADAALYEAKNEGRNKVIQLKIDQL